jgi:UDP-glucose:(heptosyl)LPS alpha-1,3-glucosyltransferase
MNIGLVIESLDLARGGAEQWTSQFAQWLLAAGHEVHVVAAHVASHLERSGLVAHPIEAGRSRTAFAAAAELQLDKLSLDVIHDMGSGWHCDVFQPHGGSRRAAFEQNLLLAPAWTRPIKRRTAAWLPRYRDFQQLVNRQYRADDRLFVALSRMVANDFVRYHHLRPDQVRLVYNGVDLARYSPDHRPAYRQAVRKRLSVCDDELLLVIVAHNFRLKGVPTLLAAASRLAAEGAPVRVAVVGGKRLPQQRAAGGITSFVGPVDDAGPYYAAADVYVQPTYYDPCSLVLLEALASGLPVVTSRFNGAGELLTPGVEGWLVDDPGDAAELAGRLRPLLDPAVRSAMGVAARKLALAHSFERNCREMLAVYQEIAERRRRAA